MSRRVATRSEMAAVNRTFQPGAATRTIGGIHT